MFDIVEKRFVLEDTYEIAESKYRTGMKKLSRECLQRYSSHFFLAGACLRCGQEEINNE